MCGIVGLIGSDIDHKCKKMLKELLIIDTIRGGDSTGFFSTDGEVVVGAKKAIDGWGFTNMTVFTKQMNSISFPSAIVGHNRWATQGKVTDGNAHPFNDGDIHLVHNGSLKARTWDVKGETELARNWDTYVDSEAICFNVADEGLTSTVSKLNGAFAIVSYDETTSTLSFVRNSERPLYFANVKGKDVMIFASEAYMINLVAEKNDVVLDIQPWLLKEGVIMSFDVSLKSKVLDSATLDPVKFFVPKVVDYGTGGYWNKATNKYQSTPLGKMTGSRTTHTTTPALTIGTGSASPSKQLSLVKTHLYDFSLIPKQRVKYTVEKYIPLKAGHGTTIGTIYTDDFEDVEDVRLFTLSQKQFDKLQGCTILTEVESITYPSGMTNQGTPVVGWVRNLSKKEEEIYWDAYYKHKEGDSSTVPTFLNEFGYPCSRNAFEVIVGNGCCACGDPIQVDTRTSSYIEYILDDQPLCIDCTSEYSAMAATNKVTVEDAVMEALCS